MTRFLYTVALWLLLPWVFGHLLWRARRQPEYLRHWGERFGIYPAGDATATVWLHAVSVGEARAAQPLVAAIRARYPGHRILLTHMTPTGRRTSEELFGDGVERIYLPYDYPFAVRRFLAHFRPQLGLIMETELWPNLIATCKAAGIPLALVNARLSAKSARGYARFPRLTLGALGNLAAIAAQNESDAERLRALGAPRVEVFGNIKFDIAPPADQAEAARGFRARIGARPVFLAASTREGEEALLLDAWEKLCEAVSPGSALALRHCSSSCRVTRSASTRSRPWSGRAACACSGARTERASRPIPRSGSATAWARCSPTMARPMSPSSAAACSTTAARI